MSSLIARLHWPFFLWFGKPVHRQRSVHESAPASNKSVTLLSRYFSYADDSDMAAEDDEKVGVRIAY
jgi:hypothetical protein